MTDPLAEPTIGDLPVSRTWELRSVPRKWQRAAFARWNVSKRGVVSVVTGAGKTIFALQCLSHLHQEQPSTRFLVVVPTSALLDQWHVSISRELSLPPESIGLLGAGKKPIGDEPIVIAILDSARRFIDDVVVGPNWCLIVDECHRAASPANRAIFGHDFVATLGLSATPERQYDTWFEEYVLPALGPVIYRYTYDDAKRDGILADFSLWNIRVPLTNDEAEAIDQVNAKIRKELGRLKNQGLSESDYLKRLLLQRSRTSQNARSRISTTLALAEKWRGQRGIVFHESVLAAKLILDSLNHRRHRARIYHSGMSDVLRYENLRLYSEGQIDIIVSCRALDEGFDVPDTDFGIIAASSSSLRQRTQRLGRVLRPSPRGSIATIATLYALPTEETLLRNEADRIEGVGQVRWFGAHKI